MYFFVNLLLLLQTLIKARFTKVINIRKKCKFLVSCHLRLGRALIQKADKNI